VLMDGGFALGEVSGRGFDMVVFWKTNVLGLCMESWIQYALVLVDRGILVMGILFHGA
jgi:hypothetical protein